MKINKILLLSLGLLLFSCSKPPLYEKSYSFADNHWDQTVKPRFIFNVEDSVALYDFTINLRTTTDYKYNNLLIFITTITPDGQRVREPYEIKITEQNGQWLGKKTGTIVENKLLFKNRNLPRKGKYFFLLEQGITASSIDQVLDISMKVEKSKN